ncbi:hypothetical protein [Hippea sp. KM1]|uniref:hypothetical protein n=1 Tax=Hippea sp. KM1 TaxID=944481 RepID=UPI00046CE88B|nr:hypothetical protein [Hippea sp. KM1]
MQINSINLTPKQAATLIKNLFRLGEIVDAEVVSKKSNNTYIVRIKGELFEATSNIPLTTDKAKLIVKQVSPNIILKLTDNEKAYEFIKAQAPPIEIEVKEETIIESLTSRLKKEETLNNPKKLLLTITMLNDSIDDEQIKTALSELEMEFIKTKTIDRKRLENIISKIEHITDKTQPDEVQKLTQTIKEAIKHIKIENPNNLFVQIPVIKQQKIEHLYIREEKGKNQQEKRYFKITVISNNARYGLIQIDALEIEGKISVKLSFENKRSFELFSKRLQKLKQFLGNDVNVVLGVMDRKPILIPKRLNIKI